MVVEFQYVGVVKLVLNAYFKSDLVNETLATNLLLGDDFDCVDCLGDLVSHFVNFAESSDADATAEERLKVIFIVFALFSIHD